MTEADDGGPVTRRSDPDGRPAYKFRVGEIVSGKYRIESMLGAGGMGAVFRAHHVQLNRPVAIKVMHSNAIDDAQRRFALEARATAALKSAHAVRILDIDRLPSGVPFIVMELLDGKDLASIVEERGPLSVDRAVHYILQVSEAIAEAHTNGIIHRDLKPQNMILTNDGIVKVLDFGLAKALKPPTTTLPDSGRTGANIVIGTPHYMSPEQILSGSVDERTDIWGLGAAFYTLLAGEPPYPWLDLDVLTSRPGLEEPPRVSHRRDDVTPTVDAVILRCLRRDPAERYQTIAALQGGLLHLRVEQAAQGSRNLLGDTARFDRAPKTIAGSSDDEPTEISTSLHETAADFASTRKP